MFGNLLSQALGVIPAQILQHRKLDGTSTNSLGVIVPTFGDAGPVRGSLQAVDEEVAQRLGITERERHRLFYSSADLFFGGPGEPSDQVVEGANIFDVIGETDWRSQDGWRGYLLRRVA